MDLLISLVNLQPTPDIYQFASAGPSAVHRKRSKNSSNERCELPVQYFIVISYNVEQVTRNVHCLNFWNVFDALHLVQQKQTGKYPVLVASSPRKSASPS